MTERTAGLRDIRDLDRTVTVIVSVPVCVPGLRDTSNLDRTVTVMVSSTKLY